MGYRRALLASARPGHSEHQLGTAVDLKTPGGAAPWAYADWGSTRPGAWLARNSWRYGWVLSYPRGKSPGLTCYKYEPWHFRYVGRPLAARIHASGLTPREWLWREGATGTWTGGGPVPTPTPSPTPSVEPTPTPALSPRPRLSRRRVRRRCQRQVRRLPSSSRPRRHLSPRPRLSRRRARRGRPRQPQGPHPRRGPRQPRGPHPRRPRPRRLHGRHRSRRRTTPTPEPETP